MRIRPGSPVTGVVVRLLSVSPRTRSETFRMLLDGAKAESWATPGEDELVVGRFFFSGVAGQPILLWDAPVPALVPLEVQSFFAGNLDSFQPPKERVIEATGLRPLSDAEFWPIIDSLGGRTWEKTIAHASKTLSTHGEEFSLRWAQTAGLKALALAEQFHAAGVAARDQLHVIGATIAQGADAFARVLNDPKTFDGAWLADLSSQVIWLGSGALDRLTPRGVRNTIETTFSASHREILAQARAEREEYRILNGFARDDPAPLYRVGRTIAKCANGYRERLILFAASGIHDRDVARVIDVADSFGGETIAGPELSTDGGLAALFSADVFTIKRRNTEARATGS